MTEDQHQDLFIKWDLYGSREQKAILAEYCEKHYDNYTRQGLLDFLKQKIETEGCWEEVHLGTF